MPITWRFVSISALLAHAACAEPPPPVVSLGAANAASAGSTLPLTPSAAPRPVPASAAPASAAVPAAAAPGVDPTGLSHVADAAFGGLALGLSGADVIKLLGKPATKGKVTPSPGVGLDLSTWTWPAKGVEVEMEWTTKKGSATVHQVVLKAPSTLKNPQGIGIGSSRAEVLAAVGARVSVENPPTPERVVMGSIFDGVQFELKGDRVAGILVGAGAE